MSEIDPHTKARSTDPSTSHAAARHASALASEHQGLILACLHCHSELYGEGLNIEELSDHTDLDKFQVARRMKELLDMGKVRWDGVRALRSGRFGRVWFYGSKP